VSPQEARQIAEQADVLYTALKHRFGENDAIALTAGAMPVLIQDMRMESIVRTAPAQW
jgi:hypothetical protein